MVDDHEKKVDFEALFMTELSHLPDEENEDQNRNELDNYQEFETHLLSDVEFEESDFDDLDYDPSDQVMAQADIGHDLLFILQHHIRFFLIH